MTDNESIVTVRVKNELWEKWDCYENDSFRMVTRRNKEFLTNVASALEAALAVVKDEILMSSS